MALISVYYDTMCASQVFVSRACYVLGGLIQGDKPLYLLGETEATASFKKRKMFRRVCLKQLTSFVMNSFTLYAYFQACEDGATVLRHE